MATSTLRIANEGLADLLTTLLRGGDYSLDSSLPKDVKITALTPRSEDATTLVTLESKEFSEGAKLKLVVEKLAPPPDFYYAARDGGSWLPPKFRIALVDEVRLPTWKVKMKTERVEGGQPKCYPFGSLRKATQQDLNARWGGGKPGVRFRCWLCGHHFELGDKWRAVYTNDIPGTYGNFLVCEHCDDGYAIEKYKNMCAEIRRIKEIWWHRG